MGFFEEKNLLVYLKPLFNVSYSFLVKEVTQPLDHFPTIIRAATLPSVTPSLRTGLN